MVECVLRRSVSTYEQEKQELVRSIRRGGVTDERVLRAMEKVPRHEFVPDSLMRVAYVDRPLPIGEDQTISQPSLVARMSSLLELEGDEKVLEIGTGSGYQTAVLAELAKEVWSIERIENLAENAKEVLNKLGYENVTVRVGDGALGWEEEALFEAIMVTAGAVEIPEALVQQLAEGGRLVIPVGKDLDDQELVVGRKIDGELKTESVAKVRFVPLVSG